jgi:TonB family protein
VTARALPVLVAIGLLAPHATAAPRPASFSDLASRLLGADTLAVEHLRVVTYTVPDPRAGERRRYRTSRLSVARADTAWGRRFARVLLEPGRWDSLARCVPRPPAGDSVDAFAAGVTFRGREGETGVLVLFGSRCAQVFGRQGPEGALDAAATAGRLLALVQEALPADSAFASLALAEPLPEDTAARTFPLAVDTPVDSLPRAVERVRPRWPADASGPGPVEVRVLVLVDENGSVADARPRSPRPPFDAAAVEAVLRWRFQPARRAGQPVRVWVEVPVRFEVR